MTIWTEFLKEISQHLAFLKEKGCPDPFFRGVNNSNFPLEPELARKKEYAEAEDRIYWRFQELGTHLMPSGITSWDILFLMRQHNLPTRLLDWTENFSVALYFALKDYKESCKNDAVVWILNPYELNKISFRQKREEKVYNLNSDFPEDYLNYFLNSEPHKRFPASILAVSGSTILPRMQWQRSTFTLHRDLSSSLEKIFPEVVKKFTIPCDLIRNAKEFLHLVGMNEFGAFPDLDGLARYIRESELDDFST